MHEYMSHIPVESMQPVKACIKSSLIKQNVPTSIIEIISEYSMPTKPLIDEMDLTDEIKKYLTSLKLFGKQNMENNQDNQQKSTEETRFWESPYTEALLTHEQGKWADDKDDYHSKLKMEEDEFQMDVMIEHVYVLDFDIKV